MKQNEVLGEVVTEEEFNRAMNARSMYVQEQARRACLPRCRYCGRTSEDNALVPFGLPLNIMQPIPGIDRIAQEFICAENEGCQAPLKTPILGYIIISLAWELPVLIFWLIIMLFSQWVFSDMAVADSIVRIITGVVIVPVTIIMWMIGYPVIWSPVLMAYLLFK